MDWCTSWIIASNRLILDPEYKIYIIFLLAYCHVQRKNISRINYSTIESYTNNVFDKYILSPNHYIRSTRTQKDVIDTWGSHQNKKDVIDVYSFCRLRE